MLMEVLLGRGSLFPVHVLTEESPGPAPGFSLPSTRHVFPGDKGSFMKAFSGLLPQKHYFCTNTTRDE